MKKISILFVIVSFFACNGKKIPQTQPNKGRRTASSSQPTSVKDSILAKPLKNETLFNVEGSYSLEPSDSDCKFDLTLYRETGQLRYKLFTKTRNLMGSAEIELNEKKDGYYLDLKDLEWSENEGSLNDEGEPIEDDIKIPTSVREFLPGTMMLPSASFMAASTPKAPLSARVWLRTSVVLSVTGEK